MSLTTQHTEFNLKEDGCVRADYREEERPGKGGEVSGNRAATH